MAPSQRGPFVQGEICMASEAGPRTPPHYAEAFSRAERGAADRQDTVAALRASEERYHSLFQNAPVMLHSIDCSGRLISVSNVWLETLGYTRAEVLGRRSLEFLTPESRRHAEQVVLPAYFQTGDCRDIPYQMVAKDGRVLDVLLSATAERDAAGQIVRSLAVIIDVTARKRAEAERGQLEARLRRAQRMEALGQLAGGLAHDFNNILTAVLGNVELLRNHLEQCGALDDPARQHLEQVERAALRAASLTRQMLTFSRQQTARRELLDLNAVLTEMEKMLRRLIPESVALDLRLAADLPPLRGDAGQVEQIVLNLVVNARDAMPDGGTITLETVTVDVGEAAGSPDARPGPHVVLIVRDTGCGIPAEALDQIFEPFFTTKPPGHGTGLGLATVDAIVRQMEGHIVVTSEPARGATFRVHFLAAERGAERAVAAAPALDAARGTETVLVCEDDETVRRLTVSILRRAGYRVLSAANARQGLDLALSQPAPLDLLITDVVMPDMNGKQLSDALRLTQAGVRTLYISGYAASTLTQCGICSVEAQLLEKPFQACALLEATRRALDHVPV